MLLVVGLDCESFATLPPLLLLFPPRFFLGMDGVDAADEGAAASLGPELDFNRADHEVGATGFADAGFEAPDGPVGLEVALFELMILLELVFLAGSRWFSPSTAMFLVV